ncbi:hypothetical protein ID866_8609 [Astraeus odoratus]|nr:hypothetical protein ID866_8609 [Astraeus odoratus]
MRLILKTSVWPSCKRSTSASRSRKLKR